MNRAVLGEIELEYEIVGSGSPVVLVHAGVLAEWFEPLMNEPALSANRLIRYHRIGYAGSSRIAGAVSLVDQAEHLRALMQHLGVERAHFVGHSSSGNILLQLALDTPDLVHSLVLLEPALLGVASGPQVAQTVLLPAVERYRNGDRAGAVDTFMRGVAGPAYQSVFDSRLPGAFASAVADADTFFGQELPAVKDWIFNQEMASRITQPVLAVIGARSDDVRPGEGGSHGVFSERQELLLSWLPNAEGFVLPEATHMLHLENPHDLADEMARFFASHPITS